MEASIIDLDPDGDLILTLRNPDAPFAVWSEDGDCFPDLEQTASASCPQSSQSASEKAKEKKQRKKNRDKGTENTLATPLTGSGHGSTSCHQNTQASSAATGSKDDDIPGPIRADDCSDTSSCLPARSTKPSFRLRLSSRHLILSSPYFQKMLKGSWQESKPQPHHEYNVEAEDWDFEALFVLMNIIHGRNSKVPLGVDIELLSKIAVLVEYYQCYEAARFVSTIWLKDLRWKVPSAHGRDLVLWLLISWAYQDPSLFRTITRTAIIMTKGSFSTLSLPIPQKITEAINSRREARIRQILDILDAFQRDLLEDRSGHSFECSSILLGALTKELRRIGLLGQDLQLSIDDQSIESILETLGKIQSPQCKPKCTSTSFGSSNIFSSTSHDGQYCHLQSIIQSKLGFLGKATAVGLEMADFGGKGDKLYEPESRILTSHLSVLSLGNSSAPETLELTNSSSTDLSNVPTTRNAANFFEFQEETFSSARSQFMNICAQRRFADCSPEELRLSDYRHASR
ncbi:hypothetical protein MN608_09190 [Microdochium nivale]|nr:hypothetical protein MN608_09190 [Microdochium nivale]